MANQRDYYEVLGISKTASEEESILLPLIPTKEEESTIKHQLMIDSDNIYEVYYKVPETITQTNKFYLLNLEIYILFDRKYYYLLNIVKF